LGKEGNGFRPAVPNRGKKELNRQSKKGPKQSKTKGIMYRYMKLV
jgi:hypothetical protein